MGAAPLSREQQKIARAAATRRIGEEIDDEVAWTPRDQAKVRRKYEAACRADGCAPTDRSFWRFLRRFTHTNERTP